MLNRCLSGIVVLVLTSPTFSGNLKFHKPWPSKTLHSFQNVTSIDVVLELGYYLWIQDDHHIKVFQTSVHGSDPFFTYSGCAVTNIATNFPAVLKGTVEACSLAQGQWSATFSGQDTCSVSQGVTSVQICILGVNVATHMLIGPEPQDNVKVAKLTIKIIPETYQP